MIGIYVEEALYDEIKQTAAQRGQSIKDYLIGLHLGKNPPSAELERRLERIENVLVNLSSSSLSKFRPRRSPVKAALTSDPSTPAASSSPSPTARPLPHRPSEPVVDVDSDPRFLNYLDTFHNRRQREAIRQTLKVIARHGGSTTSSVIKRERGFTRTTIANRQIDRLVRDGVVLKDDSVTPYVVTFAPEWR